ncbi:aldehyde dehydrogenase family protein [Nocardioides sp. AE5]|nr:aldehyde dehydrogenase family protein [Nocardioides sp. AE5]
MRPVHEYRQLYIGGRWRDADGGESILVRSPIDESVIGSVPSATTQDVDDAAIAAQASQESWSRSRALERAEYLRLVARSIRADEELLADQLVSEIGVPSRAVNPMQVAMAASAFEDSAEFIAHESANYTVGNSQVEERPIGPVACIVPWNAPLYQASLKVAAALAAGCTVVLKPSELSSFTAFALARYIDEAGFPPGTFNLVTGRGTPVGEALVRHPSMRMVSFTGSKATGETIARLASVGVKKCALELGGKGAALLADGCDLARAVQDTFWRCMAFSGQTCAATTRMIIPRASAGDVQRMLKRLLEEAIVGDPRHPGTHLGPLISSEQKASVEEFLGLAACQGARPLTYAARSALPAHGYFVLPTVFWDVEPTMRIAQEEIFGPVLSVMIADTQEQAIEIANSTPYGLSNSVWAATSEKAMSIGRQVISGSVYINGGDFNPRAPFGGFGLSGYGRERGGAGVREFRQSVAYHL